MGMTIAEKIIALAAGVPEVKAGDILLVFKAMKMNSNIRATQDGKVKKIDVKEGDNVHSHTVMIEME